MKIRKKCRICNFKLQKIISFNKISLVGNFFKRRGDVKKFPISLNFCKKCKHAQIAEIVNPKKLFSNYLWQTSVSKSNISIFKELLSKYKKFFSKKTKLLEIASNDGSFLKYIQKRKNCLLVGVDPAKNIFKRNKNIKFINNFFNFSLSKKILRKFGKFDLIFARNVLAHVINPNEIFKGVKALLSEKGIFIVEVPHLLPILKNLQYDNIFHEHQGFHSLKSIKDLCDRNGLTVSNVNKIDSQGGSIRCEIRNKKIEMNSKVKKFINYETENNLFNQKYLKLFKNKILKHNKSLYNFINLLKKKGMKISVYGASGKGQALLQFCGIDNKLIDKVYDKSILKKGKYTPGTNIEINLSKYISRKNIDYMLLLSWNLRSEILKQETKFLRQGGKFIIPFPKPKIIKL
jgi:SAM-dependent methyltransferase